MTTTSDTSVRLSTLDALPHGLLVTREIPEHSSAVPWFSVALEHGAVDVDGLAALHSLLGEILETERTDAGPTAPSLVVLPQRGEQQQERLR